MRNKDFHLIQRWEEKFEELKKKKKLRDESSQL